MGDNERRLAGQWEGIVERLAERSPRDATLVRALVPQRLEGPLPQIFRAVQRAWPHLDYGAHGARTEWLAATSQAHGTLEQASHSA